MTALPPDPYTDKAEFIRMVKTRESGMRHLEAVLPLLEQAAAALKHSAGAYGDLSAWYGSMQWLADHDYEAAHPLSGMPTGVFSEDGLYNLLADYDTCLRELQNALALYPKADPGDD